MAIFDNLLQRPSKQLTCNSVVMNFTLSIERVAHLKRAPLAKTIILVAPCLIPNYCCHICFVLGIEIHQDNDNDEHDDNASYLKRKRNNLSEFNARLDSPKLT